MTVLGWFSFFFILFSIAYYLVGFAAGKLVRDEQDYFLAGRSLGFFSLTATLLATQIGGGMILGTAADAYRYGGVGMFYSLGMALGFVVFGCGIARLMRSFDVATTAELFEKFYHSPRLKQLASFLSILSLAGIFLSQVVASRTLLYGLGVESDLLFWIFWILLVGYTMYGGLPAVVATDVVQMLVIVAVFFSTFAALLWKGVVGGQAVCALMRTSDSFAMTSDYWISCLAMPLLFTFIEQDLAQRFFSARSGRVAMLSAWASAAGILLFAGIPALLGVQARLSDVMVPVGQNPLVVLCGLHLGAIGQALVLCALVAAVASTADSLLCAISSNVVQDFGRSGSREMRMWMARAATVIVGFAGVFGSFYCSDILHILSESYQLLVSCIFVPVVMCFFRRVPRYYAGLWSVMAGMATYLVLVLSAAPCGSFRSVMAISASLIAYGMGWIITKEVRHGRAF